MAVGFMFVWLRGELITRRRWLVTAGDHGKPPFARRMHRDHEPIQRWGETPSSPGILAGGKVRVRRSLTPPRFMESRLSLGACIGIRNRMEWAVSRQRLGVRRPSGALTRCGESGGCQGRGRSPSNPGGVRWKKAGVRSEPRRLDRDGLSLVDLGSSTALDSPPPDLGAPRIQMGLRPNRRGRFRPVFSD